ncbi:Reticuline oxidase [Podospora aff. communis PSN243]|uniref:Reticuline oxidase n=1 Tax=Podospora aff. communis PSN243 TaxID=3040156 RepID=A0AAV9G527_9PEZI|nr:Reticuline oxidase [Podospora aff. communis PSN243]
MAPIKPSPEPQTKVTDADSEIEEAKRRYKSSKSLKSRLSSVGTTVIVGLVSLIAGTKLPAIPSHVSPPALQQCINAVCQAMDGGVDQCVRYPGDGDFFSWVNPYNKARPLVPAAVVKPANKELVAGIVRCAAQNGKRVQAKSGGHSYANYGLGGDNGTVAIDLENLAYVIVDETTHKAKIGGGSRLGAIDEQMGDRAFAHGVCPGVGIGGHATIGGLGPMSRMWGSTLDHILEVEVVTANGTIVRASETQNADLFWAVRGAGASFGIVTEFVMKTHKKPTEAISFTQRIPWSDIDDMVSTFQAWQHLIAEPSLDPKFGTEFELNKHGAKIKGTYYGTMDQFKASAIKKRLPNINPTRDSLVNTMLSWVDSAELVLSDVPTEFYSRSLGLKASDLLSPAATKTLFQYIHDANSEANVRWFVIFDATGGAVANVAQDATAYAHRDKVMFYQSYAFNILTAFTPAAQDFLDSIHGAVLSGVPDGFVRTTYPGYVDPQLGDFDAQKVYWGTNLARLEQVKKAWDAEDVFHNPQSVRPAVDAV